MLQELPPCQPAAHRPDEKDTSTIAIPWPYSVGIELKHFCPCKLQALRFIFKCPTVQGWPFPPSPPARCCCCCSWRDSNRHLNSWEERLESEMRVCNSCHMGLSCNPKQQENTETYIQVSQPPQPRRSRGDLPLGGKKRLPQGIGGTSLVYKKATKTHLNTQCGATDVASLLRLSLFLSTLFSPKP